MIKSINGIEVKYTICLNACDEVVNFFESGELDCQSTMVDLDIMEDSETKELYFALRATGSIWSYMYWKKKIGDYADIHIGWN